MENFLNESLFLQKQQELAKILGSNDYPTRIVLDLIGLDGTQLAVETEKYQFITTMLKKDKLFDLDITELVRYLQMTGFDETKIQNFKIRLEEKKSFERKLGLLDKQIAEMIWTRESLHEKRQHCDDILNEEVCPYCGNDWLLHGKLEAAYEELTVHLTKENAQIHETIRKIIEEIKHNFFNPANHYAEQLLQTLSPLPNELIEVIQNNEKKNLNAETLSQMKDNLGGEWQKYLIQEYRTLNELAVVVDQLRTMLLEQWLYPKEIIGTLESLKNKDFNQQKRFLTSIFSKEDFSKYQLNAGFKPTNEQLEATIDKLSLHLQSLREQFTYNTSMVADPNNIYEMVFNKSEQNFAMVTSEKLTIKMIYLEKQFAQANNRKLRLINERIVLLDKAIADSSAVRITYKDQITAYKNNMVQILKVPFFILTGKVLQNYQQGMGVFITFSENGGIRFITDQASDHDAMHHLSTGQISVISLAFTLACKKCYEIAGQMDFLVIDDPIQDMDALNIQSFVDVLRRNYLSDNQIILSTHSDNSAALIKYKLERYSPEKKVELIDVQSKFFG